MNAKQTNEDKIYVYSSFKQFCLPVLIAWYTNVHYKLFISRNFRKWKSIINYTSI